MNLSPGAKKRPSSHRSIDWASQWELYAKNFHNGKAHIDLSPYGVNRSFCLEPGPGFGDLSHPTTDLMLSFMKANVSMQTTLDIGCGSGILSIASICMGATTAYGIDIDSSALRHARKNALLNQMPHRICFSKSLPKNQRGVVLMNMIVSEQRMVLQQIPDLVERSSLWICSGFLVEQREEAQLWMKDLGLTCIEEKSAGEWLAFLGRKIKGS